MVVRGVRERGSEHLISGGSEQLTHQSVSAILFLSTFNSIFVAGVETENNVIPGEFGCFTYSETRDFA